MVVCVCVCVCVCVSSDQTEITFTGMMPTQEYVLSVFALAQDGESTPVVESAMTSQWPTSDTNMA